MNIYRLCYDSNRSLSLGTEIEYFQTHFIGEPMAAGWKPPAVLVKTKKPARDFIAWLLTAPVVSERAKTCLQNMIGPRAEFLPLIELRGKQFYAMNVLNVVDCLDRTQSEITYWPPDSNRVSNVWRWIFDYNRIAGDPVIFKVPEDGGVFVTQVFADELAKHGLTGAKLLNPVDGILAGLFSKRLS
jgi:hypothetical protein